jgi:tetratricopeptide (TPR) repeat protein
VLAFGVFAALPHAAADEHKSQDIAAAKAAFNTGRSLEAAGDYAQALGKFREVIAVKTTPQALFHVGFCLEKLGKWTEALGAYRLAAEKAEEKHESSLHQQAEESRARLEGLVPKLVIERGRGAEAAEVSVDGVPLGATAIGHPMPADPGPHQVSASAPGKTKVTIDVVLAEAETKHVPIELAATAVSPPVPTASTSAAASVSATASASSSPPTQPPGHTPWSRSTGYIVGGAGLGSLAVSGVFLFLRQRTINDLEDKCQGVHCLTSLESTSNHGQTYTYLANTFFGLGVAATAVGIFFLSTAKEQTGPAQPQPQTKTSRVWLAPAAPGGVGASLGGVF